PGADLVGHGADPAVEALAGGRPRVAGHDLDPGPERAPLVHVDLDRLGRVDDRVLGWWAPVVGVAAVAAVDQAAEPAVAVDREGAVGGVDRQRHESVADDRPGPAVLDGHG